MLNFNSERVASVYLFKKRNKCLIVMLVGVTGLQGFEMMAIAAVGNNLITYVLNDMHFPLSKSANIVTNFIGTVFLLSLFGGFLSDSYLGSFWTMFIFGFVELCVCLFFLSFFLLIDKQ